MAIFGSSHGAHNPERLGKIRVAIIGGAGTGKTAVAHLIAQGTAIKTSRSTVGVNCSVSLLQFPAGRARGSSQPPAGAEYFVELFDVGASERYASLRGLWYSGLSGVILVHDLSSPRSMASLHCWAEEVTRLGTAFVAPLPSDRAAHNLGCLPIPALIIGNKRDLLPKFRRRYRTVSWLQEAVGLLRRRLGEALGAAVPGWAAAEARWLLGSGRGDGSKSPPRSVGGAKDSTMLVHGSLQASALQGDLDMAAVQNFLFTLIERRYFSSAGGAPGAATDALAGLLHQERLPSVMWHTIAEGSEGSAALDDSLTPFGNLTPVRSNEALTRYGQGAVGGHNDTGRIDDLL